MILRTKQGGQFEQDQMNLIFHELFSQVEIKLSNYNKEKFQKNFKNFLKNLGHFYDGNYAQIKVNEPNLT